MHTDRRGIPNGQPNGQTCHAIGSRKETKLQSVFVYRETTNVGHKMCDYAGNIWSHRNSNKRCKEKCGFRIRKTFSRIATMVRICTSNIVHNTESTAVRNLKFERWGSPLV